MVAYKKWRKKPHSSYSLAATLLKYYFTTDFGIDFLTKRVKLMKRSSKSVFRKSTYEWSSCTTNFSETPWGRDLRNDKIQDPRSAVGKRFRRRFRIPFPLFLSLWSFCDEKNIFEERNKTLTKIPSEIKLLICLRILGRGECLDTIVECSGVKQATVHKIFLTFLKNFSKYKHIFIPLPTRQDIRDNMLQYSQLGLPGAIGSVDATHLHWRQCPVQLTNYCKGKEGYPTVAFQVVVNHSRKIMSVGELFYGSHNDKTLNRFDEFVIKIADEGLYDDEEFIIMAPDGTPVKVRGLYFISDNGYTKDDHFMMPSKLFGSTKEMYWSEWMESVRKDVECTFGIIKSRFRILWNGITYHKQETVEQLFVTCCMLHNIILGFDTDGRTEWENEVDWEELHPDENLAEDVYDSDEQEFEELTPQDCILSEVNVTQACSSYNENLENQLYYTANIDDQLLPTDALIRTGPAVDIMWKKSDWKTLILINHFTILYQNARISWPRAFEARLKILCPIKRNANAERIINQRISSCVDIVQVIFFYLMLINLLITNYILYIFYC
jgi:hypothetical protein